jgi:hypothetical protein
VTTHLITQISSFQDRQTAPLGLMTLLLDDRITKIGVSVKNDLIRIAKLWSLDALASRRNRLLQTDYLGMATFAHIKGRIDAPVASLQKLTAIVLDRHLAKSQVQVSDWSLIPLAADQIAYAAMDAHVSLELFRLLAPLPTVSGRVDIATPGGTAVHILGGQTIIASGILLEREPRIGRARAEVQVTDVRVPGFEIGKAGHKKALLAYGATPFTVGVTLASLTIRFGPDSSIPSVDSDLPVHYLPDLVMPNTVPLPAYPTLSRSDSDAPAAPSLLASISEREEQAGDSLDRESDSGEDGQSSDDGWGDDDGFWESAYLDAPTLRISAILCRFPTYLYRFPSITTVHKSHADRSRPVSSKIPST